VRCSGTGSSRASPSKQYTVGRSKGWEGQRGAWAAVPTLANLSRQLTWNPGQRAFEAQPPRLKPACPVKLKLVKLLSIGAFRKHYGMCAL